MKPGVYEKTGNKSNSNITKHNEIHNALKKEKHK